MAGQVPQDPGMRWEQFPQFFLCLRCIKVHTRKAGKPEKSTEADKKKKKKKSLNRGLLARGLEKEQPSMIENFQTSFSCQIIQKERRKTKQNSVSCSPLSRKVKLRSLDFQPHPTVKRYVFPSGWNQKRLDKEQGLHFHPQ